jgi:hypothetical protein
MVDLASGFGSVASTGLLVEFLCSSRAARFLSRAGARAAGFVL